MDQLNSSLAHAIELDAADELRSFRDAFVISDPDQIYLDGNSLGRLPKATAARLQEIVQDEWGSRLVGGWNQGWYDAPVRIGNALSALLGAAPGQTIGCDSTSTNLFKLVMAALEYQANRPRIVSDALNFPTDLYILQGCCRILGYRNLGHRQTLHVLPSVDGISIDTRTILDAIDEQTALVTFSYPTFKSGYLYDIPTITARAHQAGALILLDLCHAVGSVPLELDRWGVDLAVGCTYKYLNGGPGSPAFLYIRQNLQDKLVSPINGWWGHAEPFAFDLNFEPAPGMRSFLAGTPPILSMLAIEPALELHQQAGIERLRQKSIQLSQFLIELFDERLAPLGFHLGTPRDPEQRGSHVSIRHPEGYRICRALVEEMKVIPDFREPDNLRLGLAPIYTSFQEIWEGVDRIYRVVTEKRYKNYPNQRQNVT